MSRVRRYHIRRTEYEDPAAVLPADGEESQAEEAAAAEQELADRIDARRRGIRKKRTRKKRRTVIIMIIAFALALTMCSRQIIKLKAENLRLKRQHAQLEEERDRLARELGNVGNKEYIKDQARKQLRLLDPGEIMFIFDDEPESSDKEGDE